MHLKLKKIKQIVFIPIAATVIVVVLLLISSCKTKSEQPQSQESNRPDVLEMIYSIADKKGMRVISDLNMSGGAWYGTISADELEKKTREYISRYHVRYGKHKSFWGWYLKKWRLFFQMNTFILTEMNVQKNFGANRLKCRLSCNRRA